MPETDEQPLACQRCKVVPDDLWRCRVNLKTALLCPGCAATRRMRGDQVVVLGEAGR